MKNKLTDLQNHLFELMEKLSDDNLKGDELDEAIKRSDAFSSLAIIAVKNAALIAQCAQLYGMPIDGVLPLLPVSPEAIAKPKLPPPEKLAKRSLLKNKDYDD